MWSTLFTLFEFLQAVTDTTPKLCQITWYQGSEVVQESGYRYSTYDRVKVVANEVKGGDNSIDFTILCINDKEAV